MAVFQKFMKNTKPGILQMKNGNTQITKRMKIPAKPACIIITILLVTQQIQEMIELYFMLIEIMSGAKAAMIQ